MKIGIVVSEYNWDITTMMMARAEDHAKFLGAEVVRTVRVPGTFDIPLGVKKLLEKKEIDGIVALGAVIKGETDHDQVIMNNAARKIADLSLDYGKPVSLGITGPGQTRIQAMERIEKAKDAVESLVKMIRAIQSL
ncbi:MAG: 6,7-dimethyl-8-ribityllumazine synthase [Candidatus Thermoplasmatota archaeon]|nr:6,7-dimethyl-8-ribityllumazine synthase [Candidatus Thermoplasmatota archaeon]MCL5730916.1 6,7-dimethyl-8-ribityllumazine synthase [Candidatus Thermoplasmatota archaeon]